MILMGVLYVGGATFYATRFPGKKSLTFFDFDIFKNASGLAGSTSSFNPIKFSTLLL
jgi:predicted membrane channel-forming protein YqfA (hemolysin III family)